MAESISQGGTTHTLVRFSLPTTAARKASGLGGIPKDTRLMVIARIILTTHPTRPPSRPMAPASVRNKIRISRT